MQSICGKPSDGKHINAGDGGAPISPIDAIGPMPAPLVAEDVISVSKEEHSSSSSLCVGQSQGQSQGPG